MINISNLSFKYPQSERAVLKDIHLDITPGSLTLVTGASASGKSTLLRCINGLVPHFSGGTITGEISVFSLDPIREGVNRLSQMVGFVFQEPETQFVYDIVEDEIAFTLENFRVPVEEMHERVERIIHQLNLQAIRQKNIHELSGGEQQKVAIASALVSQPSVLVLDEPTSQLDPTSADDLLKFIVKIKNKYNLTVLISEHRLERLIAYCDAIAHLDKEGHLIFGKPQEILPRMGEMTLIVKIAQKLNLSPIPLTLEDLKSSIRHMNFKIGTKQKKIEAVPGEPILQLEKVNTNIGNQSILKNISLTIRKGEILALHGPNGAGKTTLIRTIIGLIPSDGEITLNGESISTLGIQGVIKLIGYLPQDPNDLLFTETVYDELRTTLENHKLPINDRFISAFLDQLGLLDKQHAYPRDLSVGERQRTALGAITVHQPQVIFLDEPTRGLDYETKQNLAEILIGWRNKGRSILLITHDVEFAASVADRVVLLEDGQIIFDGLPQNGYTCFEAYQTLTAKTFPTAQWITPDDFQVF
jgi:energy-coupling factor transport system ATP-binding protein